MNEQRQEHSAPTDPAGFPWSRIALAGAAIVAAIVLGRTAGAYLGDFTVWVESLGVWGPAVFIVGYAVAVIAFVPGSVLTLAAGAIFGLGAGTAYVFVAATLGATGAFLVARTFARTAIERRLANNPSFAAIDRAVAQQGRRIVFLLRLSPVFPFTLLNYALGLTNVRLADYVLASFGMLPGTLLYVYSGSVVGDAAVQAGSGGGADAASWSIRIVGLAATAVVTILVTRIARNALQDATGDTA